MLEVFRQVWHACIFFNFKAILRIDILISPYYVVVLFNPVYLANILTYGQLHGFWFLAVSKQNNAVTTYI